MSNTVARFFLKLLYNFVISRLLIARSTAAQKRTCRVSACKSVFVFRMFKSRHLRFLGNGNGKYQLPPLLRNEKREKITGGKRL